MNLLDYVCVDADESLGPKYTHVLWTWFDKLMMYTQQSVQFFSLFQRENQTQSDQVNSKLLPVSFFFFFHLLTDKLSLHHLDSQVTLMSVYTCYHIIFVLLACILGMQK